MIAMAPRDEAMLVRMVRTALLHDDGPLAIRYPRGAAVGVQVPQDPAPIEIGRGETLVEGERVALVGYGTGVQIALDAAIILRERGTPATVCDACFAKPLDESLVRELAGEHELLVTVEENVLAGGFGSAVLELLSDADSLRHDGPRVLRLGLPDRYVTHGKPELLRAEVGLDPRTVADSVTAVLDPHALESA
jgi:1-deoxy-D-xylulose-5-phosphate synthase